MERIKCEKIMGLFTYFPVVTIMNSCHTFLSDKVKCDLFTEGTDVSKLCCHLVSRN